MAAGILLKLFYILISVSCVKLNSKLDISSFLYHNVERSIVKINNARCNVSFPIYLRILNFVIENEIKKKWMMKRNEDSLRDLWDNIKHTSIQIIGIPEEKEKEKGSENIFEEIIVENFPNMGKETLKSRKHRESHMG